MLVLQKKVRRCSGDHADRTLQRLRRRAARLNALALVLGVGLLIAFATRAPMRTTGIIERPPGTPGSSQVRQPPQFEKTQSIRQIPPDSTSRSRSTP